MTIVAYFVILFVVLAVVFGMTVAVAAMRGWWIEFAGDQLAHLE